MSRWDDSGLWEKRAAATTDRQRTRIAGDIVEFHRGVIVQFAREKCLASWSDDLVEEAEAEAIATAFRLALQYDSTVTGEGGRSATFPTYVRSHLRDLRWRIEGAYGEPIGRGRRDVPAHDSGQARASQGPEHRADRRDPHPAPRQAHLDPAGEAAAQSPRVHQPGGSRRRLRRHRRGPVRRSGPEPRGEPRRRRGSAGGRRARPRPAREDEPVRSSTSCSPSGCLCHRSCATRTRASSCSRAPRRCPESRRGSA